MCGIAGALALRGTREEIAPERLAAMRDAMAHRGPDGAGLWLTEDRRCGLAHRRLAILDLSQAASQPMQNEAGTVAISFNGEIYNCAELRRELRELGHGVWFTDHSDTEVVLRAFEEWGIACVERFRGIFAIAFWDGRDRSLWLVRDRLGVKPLYYGLHSGRFQFASEIKALLADADQPRDVDRTAFVDHLSFLVSPAPRTLFEGISKLPAGHWLRVREDGSLRESRYWDVWEHTRPRRGAGEGELAEEIRRGLREAVRLRKLADVPVGVFLSGGMDSSANAALFSEGDPDPIRTFSIGYDGTYASQPDELPFAADMARTVGASHHERRLAADDLVRFLPRMIELQDEPLADPVCAPVYFLSELARAAGVPVCQVGEGSDELFCGYPDWRRVLRLERLARGRFVRPARAALLAGLAAVGRSDGRRSEWLRRAGSDRPIQWSGAEGFTDEARRRLLGPKLRDELGRRSAWDVVSGIRREFEEAAWEPSPLHWMSYVDLRLRLPELLLMRVDKMSMGASLEARVPFLDHELVTLLLSIPAERKLAGPPKRLLAEAMRGIVPDRILSRPKQGFGVPIEEWLRGALGRRARDEIRSFARESELLDRAEVDRCLARGRAAEVWALLNAALWWRRFIAR